MVKSRKPPALCPTHGRPKKRETCKSCNAAYMRGYMRRRRLQAPAKALWERARGRAAKRGLTFSLRKDAISVPRYCPALGITVCLSEGRTNNSPSLDRIDPAQGYVSGNVRVISDQANRLKADCTIGELERRAAEGAPEHREDYRKIAAYVRRELLLREVRRKSFRPGREGEEWAKLWFHLDRIFKSQAGGLAAAEPVRNAKDGEKE